MVDITTDQYFPNITPIIKDSKDRPASVDGVPVFASTNENVLQVSVSADGTTVIGMPLSPGVVRVTDSAEPDPETGEPRLSGQSEEINVTIGASFRAASLGVDLGEIADKPAA